MELYDGLFGPERVHVFAYEAFSGDNRSFLQQYAERLDLQVDLAALKKSRPNPPYGRGVLPVARLLNRFTCRDVLDKRYIIHLPFVYKLRGTIVKGLNRLPALASPVPAESLLGQENRRFIREFYAESNGRVALRTGLPLADYGYSL